MIICACWLAKGPRILLTNKCTLRLAPPYRMHWRRAISGIVLLCSVYFVECGLTISQQASHCCLTATKNTFYQLWDLRFNNEKHLQNKYSFMAESDVGQLHHWPILSSYYTLTCSVRRVYRWLTATPQLDFPQMCTIFHSIWSADACSSSLSLMDLPKLILPSDGLTQSDTVVSNLQKRFCLWLHLPASSILTG